MNDAFKQWYINERSKKYGIDPESIVIHEIVSEPIKVMWSTENPEPVLSANNKDNKLKIHPYF